MLTAGQKYNWAVEALGENGKPLGKGQLVTGEFKTILPTVKNSNTFSSITVLTRGLEPGNPEDSQLIDGQINAVAKHIYQEGGAVQKYNSATGKWQSVIPQGNDWIFNSAVPSPEYGKPLVLLPNWMEGIEPHKLYNSGFAEAAADVLFASMVQLDLEKGGSIGNQGILYDSTGKLIRNQGAVFNSPLHFVGFGQGAVVNSEIVQRLGTFLPNAGGTSRANRDLQMTTIDPYDYDDNSFSGPYLNILDPEIKVWNNVTYADNYYQTNGIGNTINGRVLSGTNWKSDWNVSLNNLAGFTPDDGEGASHRAALAWYAGTANLNESQFPSENGETIYRRLGDLEQNNIADATKTWYTPDHTNASFTQGDTKAPWEGIGTGWFNSVLGGGSQLRPYFDGGKKKKSELGDFEDYLKNHRVSVYEDNTPIPAMRGDYAVPTLFNGNFDAIFYENSIQNIPGWYSNRTDNELKQSALIDVAAAGIPGATLYSNGIPNYALLLGAGKSTQATHDSFVVPDWGNLRFDIFAPVRSGELNVKLETIDGQSKDVTVNLAEDANFLIDSTNNQIQNTKDIYSDIENKIGFGRKGFETFQLKLNLTDSEIANFRGKPAKITFSLDGGDSVYIDNVFFKSDSLKFGNPTQARWNPSNSTYQNNLLLEKPQYTVSYNADTKIANWVGWKVDKTWVTRPETQPGELPNGLIQRPEFITDPDLLARGLFTYDGNIFTGLGMDRGHLLPNRDRLRHPKDELATYLTTNLIAQSMDNNRFFVPGSNEPEDASAWFNIEDKVVDERANQGQELYIFAGAIGNAPNPQNKTNVPELLNRIVDGAYINQGNTRPSNLSNRQIDIPRWTWKTIMAVKQPGVDVTSSNIEAFAYMTPNTAEPDWNNLSPNGIANPLNNAFSQFLNSERGNISNATAWRNPDTWRVTLPELTNILNERSRVRSYDFNFDFLSNLP